MDMVLLSLIALVSGIVIGFALNHFVVKTATNAKNTRQELDKVRADFNQYQSKVSSHLNKTADLLARIQSSSQEAQEHIIASAQTLTRELKTHTRLQTANPYLYVEGAEAVVNLEPKLKPEVSIQPPKDYAS